MVDRKDEIMKKMKVIEMLFYGALVILGVLMLFTYHPTKDEIRVPRDFQVQWQGGDVNDVISDK